MSLIPWVLGGESATVETNPVNFQINGKAVLVREFDESQFGKDDKGREKPNASYDVRVGPKCRDHRRQNPRDVNDTNPINIPPRTAATIVAFEEVQFPVSVIGLIVPKESLLQKGLSNWPTKVDPGYNGPLHITVYNHGNKSVRLRYGDPFCALLLFNVNPAAYPRTQKGALLKGPNIGVSAERQVWTFVLGHWQWIVTTIIAVAALIKALMK